MSLTALPDWGTFSNPSSLAEGLSNGSQAVLNASASENRTPLYIKERFFDGDPGDADAVEVFLYHPALEGLSAHFRAAKPPKDYEASVLDEEAELFLDGQPEAALELDGESVKAMLFFHFRYEPLEPGHLASIIDSGHLQALILRGNALFPV